MSGPRIVRGSVRLSAAEFLGKLFFVGVVAVSAVLSPARAMEVSGHAQLANGEGAVGGTLMFDEKYGSGELDKETDVREDGAFQIDLASGREYFVTLETADKSFFDLESWVLPHSAAGDTTHLFRVTQVEECEDGKGCLQLAYWRETVAVEAIRSYGPDRTSLWQGLGGVATSGRHFDEGAALGFVAVGGWRWRDYGDDIPLFGGFGRSVALDVWVQYASTRYEVEQLVNLDDTADVTFHRLTLSAGPTWLLREVELGGGDQLHVEAGVGPSIAMGGVLDGTNVLGVDFGSGGGEERNYRFAGVGLSAWNTWWWNRPGMDLGVLVRFDYTNYLADAVASPDGDFEDRWYGGVSGLSFSLIFR